MFCKRFILHVTTVLALVSVDQRCFEARRIAALQGRIYYKPGPVQKKCGAPGPLIQ